MDGTIVDTEPLWIAAQRALLAQFGLPQLQPADEEALVGASMEGAAAVFQRLGVPLSAVEIVEHVVRNVIECLPYDMQWRPGAVELLAGLRAEGVPLALVTNSPREMAMLVVDQLPEGTFDTVVGADDVTRGKPDPQPYLLAAERLSVSADARCVVMEDSVHGLRSGTAAGMTTVGIPHGATLVPDDAHLLLPTLDGIDVAGLVAHLEAVAA